MRTQSADRTPTPVVGVTKHSVSRTVTPAGRFLAELGGMCAVMCVGGSILSFASFEVASALGYPKLVQQAPELSAAVIAVCLALPMAVYMALRGHGRRHNLEMTGSTIAVGIVVIGLLWSGVIATSGLQNWHSLFGMMCGPACLVMIVEMLISFNMYSGDLGEAERARR
jgi:heme/copper-type cytochrome/quinol oxidase subunit 4